MRQEHIPIGKLFVSKLNTRKDLQAGQEDSGIADLAASIRQKGLISPPIVRPATDGRFEVLIGQRRLLACQRIGYDPVPCLVRDDVDDSDAVLLSLVENVHRADMNPMDKARALKEMHGRFGSYEQVARETAWSASTVRKYVQLLSLPQELQQKIGTADGPQGVSALSRLAASFSGKDALKVYEKIAGFKQGIQEEIIKKSGGDVSRIDDLVEEAHEGAFDIRHCGGAFRCEIVRDILQGEMSQGEFEDLVKEVAQHVKSEVSRSSLRNAAGAFWRSLARGEPH